LFEYHKDKGNDFEHGSENVKETRFADLVDVSTGLISTGEVNPKNDSSTSWSRSFKPAYRENAAENVHEFTSGSRQYKAS
jgi:hypothetical protein